MRPYLTMNGWMISPHTIEGFPDWLKRGVYQQAVWKWIALVMLIAITFVVVLVIHRLARRRLSGSSAEAYLGRLVTPLILLLTPLVLDQADQQLTLTGWVSRGVTWMAEAISYFALSWIAWIGSIAAAEAVIASPRIPDRSLNAHLLRYVLARLRQMLLGHPKVSPDKLHVRFDGFGAYALDVAVFAYIRTRDWLTYRAIREDINLRIMDIVEEAGTGFAFPSQTALSRA